MGEMRVKEDGRDESEEDEKKKQKKRKKWICREREVKEEK